MNALLVAGKKNSHQEMVITGVPNFKCMDGNYNGLS